MTGSDKVTPPSEIEGLEWIGYLGKGQQGRVWSARRRATGQKVAVKLFRVDNPSVRWEFDRVHPTGHPHLATILDANLAHRPPYVISPFYEGSLGALARQQRFHDMEQLAFEWVTSVASALAALHDSEIFHCNLHPHNLLLDQEGCLRVADFEQTRWLGAKKCLLGSFLFMSPDQMHFDDKGRLAEIPNPGWDIYSLGASFYYAFTGKLAHRELAAVQQYERTSDHVRLRNAILDTPLVPLLACNPKLPAGLAKILERCLSLETRKRFRSADELLESLHKARGKSASKSLVLRWAEERRRVSLPPAKELLGVGEELLAASFATVFGLGFILSRMDSGHREKLFEYLSWWGGLGLIAFLTLLLFYLGRTKK